MDLPPGPNAAARADRASDCRALAAGGMGAVQSPRRMDDVVEQSEPPGGSEQDDEPGEQPGCGEIADACSGARGLAR